MDRFFLPRLHTPVAAAILLTLAVAFVYMPATRYGYVYEDLNDPGRWERSVFENFHATGHDGRTQAQIYNPLRALGMVLDGLSGAPAMQHKLSIVLFQMNCLLFFGLAWLVLPPWSAVVAMGVFALHPIQVEAVAYVSARSELVAGAGLLLALLSTSLGSVPGALVGCVVAGLGKESAIVAWAVVPVWAILTAAPFKIRRFLMIGAGLAAVGLVLAWSRVAEFRPVVDLDQMGRTAWAMVRLTGLVFLPVGQSIDHDWHGAALWVQSLAVGALVAAVLGVLYGLLVGGRPWLTFALALSLLWLGPRLVLGGHEGLHEHHLFVPMIGWALCAGAWLATSRQLENAQGVQ